MQIQEKTNESKIKSNNDDPLFDRKVDLVTAGLRAYHARCLKNKKEVSQNNALIICNYIMSMKTEINPSDNYRRTNITLLIQFSKFHNQKPFSQITREELLAFLDSLRKPEPVDPLHKWLPGPHSQSTYLQQHTALHCFTGDRMHQCIIRPL
jgi:hypothetical protein